MINKLRKFPGLSGRLAGTLLCVALGLPPAWAANPTFEEGREAYLRGDTARAVELWGSLAKQGDKEAQFAMGTLFYAGVGVAVDHTESSYWFQRAAEQGYAAAQYNLGNAYKRGEGVRQNDTMAVRWWEKAAAQGFAAAQFNLALAYYDGAGIEKNGARAMSLIKQAAEYCLQPATDLLAQLRS